MSKKNNRKNKALKVLQQNRKKAYLGGFNVSSSMIDDARKKAAEIQASKKPQSTSTPTQSAAQQRSVAEKKAATAYSAESKTDSRVVPNLSNNTFSFNGMSGFSQAGIDQMRRETDNNPRGGFLPPVPAPVAVPASKPAVTPKERFEPTPVNIQASNVARRAGSVSTPFGNFDFSGVGGGTQAQQNPNPSPDSEFGANAKRRSTGRQALPGLTSASRAKNEGISQIMARAQDDAQAQAQPQTAPPPASASAPPPATQTVQTEFGPVEIPISVLQSNQPTKLPEPELPPNTRYDGKEFSDSALKTFMDAGADKDGNMVISKDEWLGWMVGKGPTPGYEKEYEAKLKGAIEAGGLTDATLAGANKRLGIEPPPVNNSGLSGEMVTISTGEFGDIQIPAEFANSGAGLSTEQIAEITRQQNLNPGTMLPTPPVSTNPVPPGTPPPPGQEDTRPFERGPINIERKRPDPVDLDDSKLVMESDPIIDATYDDIGRAQRVLSQAWRTPQERLAAKNLLEKSNITVSDNVQELDDAKAVTTSGVSAPTFDSLVEGTATEADAPENLTANTYEGEVARNLAATDASQGTVGPDSTASPDEIRALTERAIATSRDAVQEAAAKQLDPGDLTASPISYVSKVTGEKIKISPTPEAEAATRELITGTKADDKQAAEIIDKVGFEAAERRTVTGTAAKDAAGRMLVVIGDLPDDIAATVVEDPAKVTAQLDSQPVEIREAIASLPTEALVSTQMENLLAGMDEGKTPVWARPAVAQVNDMLARRGLSASTVGRDALFNAIIQTAMPMAQSNAQALQSRSSQNLSNQQQARMAESTQRMQVRMANLSSENTAESQSAQMAQQMKTMQSQFGQDAVMTSEQMQQQVRTQNLSNRQQAAQIDAQNAQAIRSQNLGNEQQIELADLQYLNATEADKMSAVQQERMAEMQVAADFLSKNAGFKQQMDLANLGNDQQMRLANLSSQNQQASEKMSADQQTELANLNTLMQTNLTQGQIAQSMGVAQLNVDQQRAVTNATMNANLDLTRFSADQQVAVANSKFMQSMTMTDFNAEQQTVMQNATSLASMDMAAVDQRTKVSITNAQSFLGMDMANLSNRQQGVILDQQMSQQRILSDQASANASKQFNATSANQTDQFNNSMAAQMEQFNASQSNAMEQFNANSANKRASEKAGMAFQASQITEQMNIDVAKFNEQTDLQRDQWNAANAQAVEQSNAQWRRAANTAESAATNEANRQNVQNAFGITSSEQAQLWQQERDEASYIRAAYESNAGRKATMIAAAISNEAANYKGRGATNKGLFDMVDKLFPEPTT